MKHLFLLILLPMLASCIKGEAEDSAQTIVDKAIAVAGGDLYERAEIQFRFRENVYSSKREEGLYELTRTISDSLGIARDVLTNEGLERFREGEQVQLQDSMKTKYANSVNSVHYFVQLPYGLNAPAVQKELIGKDSIKGAPYYEIKVTFAEEGGGADHEDEYMYWIHQEDYTVDYLAYRFYVDGGGIRFREAYNPRQIEGLRFVDYYNYKLEANWEDQDLGGLDDLFEKDSLEFLSNIQTEIESVEILE